MRRAGAEAFGTFVLVFGGVGTAVIAGEAVGALGVAFAFGLALLAMAYASARCRLPHQPRGHARPARRAPDRAVARPPATGRRRSSARSSRPAVLLVIAKARSGGYDAGVEGFGANGYGDHSPGGYGVGAAVLVEVMLTAFLVFTVLAATDRIASVAFAGIPIGLVLTLIHLVGIPITNLSVNPARSIGPALFVGDWALEQLWLFIVAPLVGALLATGLHAFLFAGGVRVEPEESAVAAETVPGTTAAA